MSRYATPSRCVQAEAGPRWVCIRQISSQINVRQFLEKTAASKQWSTNRTAGFDRYKRDEDSAAAAEGSTVDAKLSSSSSANAIQGCCTSTRSSSSINNCISTPNRTCVPCCTEPQDEGGWMSTAP